MTWCTSIVAQNVETGVVSHVRNLDFDFTEGMKDLVYIAIMEMNGEERARSVNFAGFRGVYTGNKGDLFSLSYNVRFRTPEPNLDTIQATLLRNFDPKYTPTEILYENALLYATSYAEVSRTL